MKASRNLSIISLVLSAASCLAATTRTSLPSNNGPETASFNLSEKTQIPGKTLKPGDYTIRIVDHLTDRMIVEVDRDGKEQATFLALPSSTLPKPSTAGPLLLNGGRKAAIRGFSFDTGTLAEFVYPKAEAVGLAKANNTKIPAVDPASEGRSPDPKLSAKDMREVNLWMLSPTIVGPGSSGPGIQAERYQQVASASTPPPPPAQPRRAAKPLMTALPHTAGEGPAVALTGLCSLAAAGLLARRRSRAAC
jgi:hypothetical protein